MAEETAEQKSIRLRRTVIIGHRKRKNLCIHCGMDPHEGSECNNEEFTKADNRTLHKPKIIVDFKRKKDTIISYRMRKNLCLNCGLELHDNKCNENYSKSDNRTEDQKKLRPAIIKTPKTNHRTLLELIDQRKLKETELDIQLERTENIKLQREFVLISIDKSSDDDVVEFSCINHLSRKLKTHIICVYGNLEKSYPVSDLMKLRKLTNVIELDRIPEQELINHLYSCKMFYSFESDYTIYCKKNDIPYYCFKNGKNVTNFLKDDAFNITE